MRLGLSKPPLLSRVVTWDNHFSGFLVICPGEIFPYFCLKNKILCSYHLPPHLSVNKIQVSIMKDCHSPFTMTVSDLRAVVFTLKYQALIKKIKELQEL